MTNFFPPILERAGKRSNGSRRRVRIAPCAASRGPAELLRGLLAHLVYLMLTLLLTVVSVAQGTERSPTIQEYV